MSETREEKRWAVGQKRRGDLYDLRGDVIASDLTYVVKRPADKLAFRDDYDWECEIIDGKTQMGRDFKGACWFRDGAPSTLLSDALEAQPEKPMRSGPGVVFVPGMVVSWARWCHGQEFGERDNDRQPFIAKSIGPVGFHRRGDVEQKCWDNGCYDILYVPTQQPSPSHVCKGRPCGEALTALRAPDSSWFAAFPGGSATGDFLRLFCSPTCRDAWKPEARVTRGTCGAVLGGGDYCLRAAGADGACDRHQLNVPTVQPSSAAPSPAPWRCINGGFCTTPTAKQSTSAPEVCEPCYEHHVKHKNAWRCADRDCKTPGAAKDRLTGTGMCCYCAEKRIASLVLEHDESDAGMRRTRAEEIAALKPWLILPGSIPVSPHLEAMGGTAGSSEAGPYRSDWE